ncbi:MAG TPA: hypothetical protein VFB51_04720, partial [Solirubrobacterales bacterium]|nr:hypothetical protein [Solirubrobacterales bacterium]
IDRTGAHLAPPCVLVLGLLIATLRHGSPRARGAAGLGVLVLVALLGRYGEPGAAPPEAVAVPAQEERTPVPA